VTYDAGAESNTDCELVVKLWNLLESPRSGEYYLGNIIRNGLDLPSFGIHIAPFSTVDVGDIPEQTMFQWAAEYIGLSMGLTVLEGFDSFTGGELNCTPVSADETTIDLDLNFSRVSFSGRYEVRTTGASACALAVTSGILGGGTSSADTDRLALASWYEADGLNRSENGKVAVGTYYLHEDTIESVTIADTNPSRQYRQALARQRAAADRVTAATVYWKEQQTGEHPSGDPPKIGAMSQFAGGFQTYAALLQAVQHARAQRGLALQQGDNDYAELENAMTQMLAQVKAFQKSRPGEHDAGEIMDYVARARELSPDELRELEIEGIPVHDLDTGEVIDHVPTWPIDRDRALAAHAARAPQRVAEPQFSFKVRGSFRDTGQGVTLGVTAKFKSGAKGLVGEATNLRVKISNLQIVLSRDGWVSQPALYDLVANWIANTQGFQDLLRAKITSAVNAPPVRGAVTDALNAGLKKLGFQE
jgi:hypothetical protein